MAFLDSIWSILKTDFAYLYTNVVGVFSTILSEVPDDEIAILKGAMEIAGASIKAGRTAEETFSDCLNYVQQQEIKEFSKVTELFLQIFIHKATAV
jgi:hypothetical protein